MGKLTDQIASMEERLSQLKVRQQRQDRRARTLQSQRERREDTRRKILVGACILTLIERGSMTRDALLALLDPFLSRPDDRHLFGLPEGGPVDRSVRDGSGASTGSTGGLTGPSASARRPSGP